MAYLYRERRYYCGRYLEVDLFPVFPAAKGRSKKKKPTSEIQNKLNEHNAEAKLTRILNANFSENDVEVHLTFSDDSLPETDEEALKLAQNYMRRVKYLRKKRGLPEMKSVFIIEGSANGPRLHYHVTMTAGLDRDELEALWPYGYANARRLQFNENGIEGLARYITKQFREKKNAGETAMRKRWMGSRNLVIPPPHDRDGRISERRVKRIATRDLPDTVGEIEKLYPGYVFSAMEPVYNEQIDAYYVCIRLFEKPTCCANCFRGYRSTVARKRGSLGVFRCASRPGCWCLADANGLPDYCRYKETKK